MENKQETLEEAAERIYPDNGFEDDLYCDEGKIFRESWLEGAKWQQERSYSEEEVRGLLIKFHNQCPDRWEIDEWFNQNKKK